LKNLTSLTRLSLWGNRISDLRPLQTLSGLTYLVLSRNSISDISPLAFLTALKQLDLTDNNISDIHALVINKGLDKGDTVYLSGNPLSADAKNKQIPQLKARGVRVIFNPAAPDHDNSLSIFFPQYQRPVVFPKTELHQTLFILTGESRCSINGFHFDGFQRIKLPRYKVVKQRIISG
jgi:hypothetical protein